VILKLKRTPGIYLVGFMGSGKSTVGRMLADRIGWRFVDLDEDIEIASKTNISNLFEKLGEEEFRRLESEAIRQRVRKVQAGNPMVIALGGGAFTRPENIDLLINNGVTIWLDVPLAIARKRVEHATHRPLARDPARFDRLFEERRSSYAQADHHVVIAEDNSRVAFEKILELPIWH
jgi:shikimate kinase